VLADFKAYLLIPQVRFYPKPLIFQVFRDFQAVFLLSLRNSHHHGLYRSQPGRQFAGVVLDQYPDKTLQRPKHRPMQHDRGVLLAVFANVSRAEAPWHIEVHLQGAALPIAPNGIPQHELELRSVERPFSAVQRGFDAGRCGRLAQRGLGSVPNLIRTHPLCRPIRELDPHIVETEVAVDAQDQLGDLDGLRGDLVRGAKNMGIVLSKGAHPHEPVQRPRGLVAMDLAELRQPQRQLSIAAQPLAEHLNMSRAIHRLDRKRPIVRRLGQVHVLAEGLDVP
jgi:hypothetical protein